MILLPYKDITDVIKKMFFQVQVSLKFVRRLPLPRDPERLFYYLKEKVRFKKDPPGVELLQRADTLLKNNYHGCAGCGDCDCFTILALSCCVVLNFNVQLILAGRNEDVPVHVYLLVEGKPFDLTNDFFGYERFYPYKQVIYPKIYHVKTGKKTY